MGLLQVALRKWWVTALQGVLLIILSFYIFQNPLVVLAGVSMWFGVLVLAAGVVGIVAWLSAESSERDSMSLLWSGLTAVFGLMMLTNMLATMKSITVIIGVWALLTGLQLAQAGWSLKDRNAFGWIVFGTGLFSTVAGIMMIFNIGSGAVGLSTLLGLQVLLAGIGLVLFAFAKKALASRVTERIQDFRSR